jgi:CHAT domain-containing protein
MLSIWRYFPLLVLVPLLPLKDAIYDDPFADFTRAKTLFLSGHLEACQLKSAHAAEHLAAYNPEWADRFRVLEAEAMVWRGVFEDALGVLAIPPARPRDPETTVKSLTLRSVSLTRLHQLDAAESSLHQAEVLCKNQPNAACGDVPRTRGLYAMERGQLSEARNDFLLSLEFGRSHRDPWLETTALLNLGYVSLETSHFDEALDWSTAAYRAAMKLGAESLAQNALGNIGRARLELGDFDQALEMFLDAEQKAAALGNILHENKWLANAGYVYQETGDLRRAEQSYREALALARKINSRQDILNLLEVLAYLSTESGILDSATAYLNEAEPIARESGNRLDELYVSLARGRIFATGKDYAQAEQLFRSVEADTASETSMRLAAQHERARLFESEANPEKADRMYKTALTTFESARAELKDETSRLPFLANATSIYDDYIHFLVGQGKSDLALAVADQSRARTLAEGLGLSADSKPFNPGTLHPISIAAHRNSTLLFYWLGQRQSYLWAITPKKAALFALPPESQITAMVEHYRKTLLGLADPLALQGSDAESIYRALVAPAADLIPPGSKVVILSDGPLSLLNFETLVVPGNRPHYWIEDATLISAPSLYMLSAAKSSNSSGGRLLLVGNAVSPSPDFPDLPMASFEMKQIKKHFAPEDASIFSGEEANPDSYLKSSLPQYSYIHFVAHGVASRVDPLDSAIILSPSKASDDSFKLYARDIIQHPIRARLVTISACSGSGTKSYAGEGLVGLSWAFLRAGAHNVIGALWDVSDDSTPRLMGVLYQGLDNGLDPSEALREAKLSLLNAGGDFSKPFFWAPFQIYTGL